MNRLQFFRLSKYTRLLIGAIAILIIYLSAHLAFNHLTPVRAAEPESGIQIDSITPTTPPEPGIGWEISSTSGAAEIELANYLTRKDVKVYGAYFCPHCYEQQQLFGKEAWNNVKQIECAADAKENPQPEVCKQAGIKGFPTWSIDGELVAGVKKLTRLGELTGYQGNTDFKYDRLLQQE
jgi:hypothetical protein